jgi:DNA (cytosine-5)-methyltransferase 1
MANQELRQSQPREYMTGELFCGAGGLSRGFHSSGFRAAFANDAWPLALHNFMMNFDAVYALTQGQRSSEVLALPGPIERVRGTAILERVPAANRKRLLRRGELDVLLGGPPCQGYSLNSHNRDGEDPRNHLFRHYIRLLNELSPKIFVLENVPGMLSLDGGRFFLEFVRKIEKPSRSSVGYEIDYKILNAAHYGVPQERFRIVVVGTRRDVADEGGKVLLPDPQHYSHANAHFKGGRTLTFHYAIGRKGVNENVVSLFSAALESPIGVAQAIGDLPPLENGAGENVSDYAGTSPACPYQELMRIDSSSLANHWCRKLFPPNTERVKHIPVGGDWRSIPRRLLPPGMQRALRKDHTTRYGRLSPESLAGTLLTKPDPHWGTFLHYDLAQQRLISVREAARFQSFPDRHVFFGGQVDQYRLVGNAVPPLMAQAIATKAKAVLDGVLQHRSAGSSRRLTRA